MDTSALVKVFGFPATLIHGDPMVLDRWLWLRRRLPPTRNGERLIEFGCGSGAFTIGAALRGYDCVGVSWDERNQSVAAERAQIVGARCRFEILDLRRLSERTEWREQFDVAVACEVIEHVLDDRKLIQDMARCLKPGGRLLLTTPSHDFIPLAVEHAGPFSELEDGGHVRRGYSPAMLTELCEQAGLHAGAFSSCSGFTSQLVTKLYAQLRGRHGLLGWALTLPLRPIPPLVSWVADDAKRWPSYSICLEGYKPRF